MAKPSFGCILKMGSSSPPSTTLSARVSVTPPKMDRAAIDVTTHGSTDGAMEFIADGVYNPGQLTFSMNYVAGSADDDACIAAWDAGADGGLYYFSWTAKAGTGTETFTATGVVTSYGPDELGTSGKQSATMAIQLSGPVTQAPTA